MHSHAKSVLVVEDEVLLALDAEAVIEAAGYRVAGVAASVEQAVSLIECRSVDLAVLDYDLGGQTSEALAVVLSRRGIPYAVVSGAARESLVDAGFAPEVIHAKPADYGRIVAALANG